MLPQSINRFVRKLRHRVSFSILNSGIFAINKALIISHRSCYPQDSLLFDTKLEISNLLYSVLKSRSAYPVWVTLLMYTHF